MKASKKVNMTVEFELKSLEYIDEIASNILTTFSDYKVYTLIGDLGAGKTTLTQAFCRYLEVKDEVVSPTYTLINEYITKQGKSVFHSDLYRIESTQEAINTGIEDYLFSNSYCFIEWPQTITPILPDKFIKLELKNLSDQGRKIIATTHG